MDIFKDYDLHGEPHINEETQKTFLKIKNFFDLKKIGKDDTPINENPPVPEYTKNELEKKLIISRRRFHEDKINPSLEPIRPIIEKLENPDERDFLMTFLDINNEELKQRVEYEKNRISVYEEIFAKHFADIVSLNNFLFLTHDTILKTSPFSLTKTKNKTKPIKWKNNYTNFEKFNELIPPFLGQHDEDADEGEEEWNDSYDF